MKEKVKIIVIMLIACFSFLGCEQETGNLEAEETQVVSEETQIAEEENQIEFEYEEVGIKKASIVTSIIIYTETTSLDELEKLSKKYKAEHEDMKIFQIMFFDDKELAKESVDAKTLNNKQLLSWFATYNYNENTEYEHIGETFNNLLIEGMDESNN